MYQPARVAQLLLIGGVDAEAVGDPPAPLRAPASPPASEHVLAGGGLQPTGGRRY
jgi:hypothetical protein